MCLIIPPFLWHLRNRNIGATALIGWTIVLLFFNFLNAVLWPSDNFNIWPKGDGLCDVESKVLIASQIAIPASFACVLRALAAVLDTERASMVKTQAQRRRAYCVDLSWCIGFPMLQMLFHYIIQPRRFYIYGISGCVPAMSANWLSMLLMIVWPTLWIAVDTYYAGKQYLWVA